MGWGCRYPLTVVILSNKKRKIYFFMDKYTILTILIASLVLLLIGADIANVSSELVVANDEYFGLVTNIKETNNGFIFDLVDINGHTIPCFTSTIIKEQNHLQIITGTFSEDHKIFFVNTIQNY